MDSEYFDNIDVSDKHIVIPQVVIYKNLFDKNYLKEIVNILEKDEKKYQEDIKQMREKIDYAHIDSLISDYHGFEPQDLNNENPLATWVPWYSFGSKTIFNNRRFLDNFNNKDYEKLNEFKNKLEFIFYKIYLDYTNDWKNSEHWAVHLTNWNLEGLNNHNFNDKKSELSVGTIEVLKHDIFLKGQAPNGDFTIKYHTDSNESRWDEPRHQQLITMTFYLNDDYEGGEVDFVNEKDKNSIGYKPETGDITVFPSGVPYWHAARSVNSGNNKFFIRIFISWHNPGSEKWHKGVEKYGYDKWYKKYVEEAIENQHTVLRQIVKKESLYNSVDVDENGKPQSTPLYIESETYLDSKKLNKNK